VPSSSSWLNLIERWLGELTGKRVRRGSFADVDELQRAISEFLAAWSEQPKPFVWTATVDMIHAKLGALPSKARADPTRLHAAATQTADQTVVQLILGHYTSLRLV
jgi:hypothetical protein